ncbi:MAG: hypothetical protein MUP74_01030, partial [Desulfobacterales bacterium]|nr:hypothetical protein [Desulfobacterales bacterium]
MKDFEWRLSGRCYKLGHDVPHAGTVIPVWLISGRYTDPKDLVPHLFEGTIAAASLIEGTNTLTFTNVGDTGVVSRVFLDRVEIDYPEAPALRAGRFGGEWTEEGVAEVALGGAPSHSDGLLPWSGPEDSAPDRTS